VIGEHGDSEVLTWSLVTVAGMPLESFTKLRGLNVTEEKRREIDRQVRQAA
jgi:L-lactate dehydrogenase